MVAAPASSPVAEPQAVDEAAEQAFQTVEPVIEQQAAMEPWPIREVVNMLDALKYEVEGEGENSYHCGDTECHCENALEESIADAELKSDETSKDLTSKDLGDAVEKYRPNNDAKTKVSIDEAPLASLLRWLMSHPAAWAMGRMAAAVFGDAASSYRRPPRASWRPPRASWRPPRARC